MSTRPGSVEEITKTIEASCLSCRPPPAAEGNEHAERYTILYFSNNITLLTTTRRFHVCSDSSALSVVPDLTKNAGPERIGKVEIQNAGRRGRSDGSNAADNICLVYGNTTTTIIGYNRNRIDIRLKYLQFK